MRGKFQAEGISKSPLLEGAQRKKEQKVRWRKGNFSVYETDYSYMLKNHFVE